MNESLSRRDTLKALGAAAGALLVARVAGAAGAASAVGAAATGGALPHVAATDPAAIALGYHENAKTVDAAKFPTYRPEQKCAACIQLRGNEGDAWRPCNLYPGRLVSTGGWCKVYAKRA